MRIFKIARMFHVPQKVLEPIRQYILQGYQQFIEESRKRITKKSFPPKEFVLDFSGTDYEFVNNASPKNRTITVHFTNNSNGTSYAFTQQKEIYINFAGSFTSIFTNTLEHEIMHIVQQIISDHIGADEIKAGLVPKQFRSKEHDVEGYRKENKEQGKRGQEHSQRDVEKYPDLISLTRSLQMAYEAAFDQEIFFMFDKKEFLSKFFQNPDSLDSFMSPQAKVAYNEAKQRWKSFSKASVGQPQYRKWLMKKIYDEFINQTSNFQALDILDKDRDMQELRRKVQEQKKENSSVNPKLTYKNQKGETEVFNLDNLNKLKAYSDLSLDARYDFLPDWPSDASVTSSEAWEHLLEVLPYIKERISGWG